MIGYKKCPKCGNKPIIWWTADKYNLVECPLLHYSVQLDGTANHEELMERWNLIEENK